MRTWLAAVLLFASSLIASAAGRVLVVDRLDDDTRKPVPGMLRWALTQKGARTVKFSVSGDIRLKSTISVRHGGLVMDGSTAPDRGVCIRGGSLEFEGADRVTLRYLRFRLGDETLLRRLKAEKRKRPSGSHGLDCLNFVECDDVRLEHCSLSWSCDELLSIVRCQNMLVSDCIFSEPLGDAKLHPYGEEHAFAVNASASTLLMQRCLFAHYVMRGPQFEANDLRRGDSRRVKMSAMDCVMFDYKHSGSRYTTGVENHPRNAKDATFDFAFKDNQYVARNSEAKAIEAVTKHGRHPGVRMVSSGNAVSQTASDIRAPWLDTVGCSHQRDAVDARILDDVFDSRFRDTLRSQSRVGGWPPLDGSERPGLLRFLARIR